MPFTKKKYGTKKKFEKYNRCTKKVSKQTSVNPYAICRKSVYGDNVKFTEKGQPYYKDEKTDKTIFLPKDYKKGDIPTYRRKLKKVTR